MSTPTLEQLEAEAETAWRAYDKIHKELTAQIEESRDAWCAAVNRVKDEDKRLEREQILAELRAQVERENQKV